MSNETKQAPKSAIAVATGEIRIKNVKLVAPGLPIGGPNEHQGSIQAREPDRETGFDIVYVASEQMYVISRFRAGAMEKRIRMHASRIEFSEEW